MSFPMDTEEQKRLRAKQRQATASIRYHERFFASKWFNVLSEADGNMILQTLTEEVA